MVRVHSILLLSVLCCIGCGTDAPRDADASSKDASTALPDHSATSPAASTESELSAGHATAAANLAPAPEADVAGGGKVTGAEDAAVETRRAFDDYVARFNNKGIANWHYGERTPGELAGTWVSVDGDGHRVVFGADGSFSEDFNGNMTTGLYAISDEGQIVAYSKWNEIGLGSHFKFDGKLITGPRGPLPNAQWRKTPQP